MDILFIAGVAFGFLLVVIVIMIIFEYRRWEESTPLSAPQYKRFLRISWFVASLILAAGSADMVML